MVGKLVTIDTVRISTVTDGTLAVGEDDYEPTGGGSVGVWLLGGAQTSTISGIISNVITGRVVRIINIGTFPIILLHNATGLSSPNNVFQCPNTNAIVVMPDGGMEFVYSSAAGGWLPTATDSGLPSSVENLTDLQSIGNGSSGARPERVWVRDIGFYQSMGTTGLPLNNPYVVDSDGAAVNRWIQQAPADPDHSYIVSSRQDLSAAQADINIFAYGMVTDDRVVSIRGEATIRGLTTGDSGVISFFAGYERTSGTVSLIDTIDKTSKLEAGLTEADVNLVINGTSIEIQGTAEDAEDTRFRIWFRVMEDRP